jgi:hypothetical protein
LADIVLEGAEQTQSENVLVVVVVDQALAVAGKVLGIALEVAGQRECPAELDRAAPGRKVPAQEAE